MIKNIIFDLGGVLFRINYSLTFENLGPLLGHSLNVGEWPEWFKDLVYDYETGKIPTERFIMNLQRRSNTLPIPQGNDIVHAWNSMLIGWQEGVFSMLDDLKKNHRLFILSNISPLHVDFLKYTTKDIGGIEGLHAYFDGIYFSNEIGYRKPDVRCFEHVLNKNSIIASETLFIDDFPKNFIEAKKLGIKCIEHDTKKNIKSEINFYLGLVC